MNKDNPHNRLIADDESEEAPPVQRYEASPVRPSPTRNPRRNEGKSAYPGRRQVTAYVGRDLFLYLKSISAQTDKPMIEIFEEALSAYVSSFAAKKKFEETRGK